MHLPSLAKGSAYLVPQAGAGREGLPTLPEDYAVSVHSGCISSLGGGREKGRTEGGERERNEGRCPEL